MDKFHLFPPAASTTAQQVDWLLFGLLTISSFFCAVVFLPIFFFAIKYRRGSSADRVNPPPGSLLLEAGWALFPLVLAIGLFSWGAIIYFRMQHPPGDVLQVQ